MKYFEDDMYFDDDEFCSYTDSHLFLEVLPLKLTSADNCLASPDDWLDTILYIRGIK
jgi:hypothetical protein